MSPKFLSALLSVGNPCLSGFLERTSLEFKTGFWQIGSVFLAVLSLADAAAQLGCARGRGTKGFPFWVAGLAPSPPPPRP